MERVSNVALITYTRDKLKMVLKDSQRFALMSLHVGVKVQTHSLSVADYNGLSGTVIGAATVNKDNVTRVPVSLQLHDGNKKIMSLQPHNLMIIASPPAKNDTESGDLLDAEERTPSTMLPPTSQPKLSNEEWFAREEEGRVLAHPPPPLWDENIEERFIGKSIVFLPMFQKMQKAWNSGEGAPNTTFMSPCMTVAHTAATTGDIPMLRALGRFDADYNVASNPQHATPLFLILRIRHHYGGAMDKTPLSVCGSRPDAETLEWILSRGGDANICCTDGTSPLELALTTRPVEMDICELLLLHGAVPQEGVWEKCPDLVARKKLKEFVVSLQANHISRPRLLCPCGNNVAVELCHGSERGVPVHPRMLCPCKSVKLYKKCCFKRRHFFREGLTANYPPPRYSHKDSHQFITQDNHVLMLKFLAEGRTAEAMSNIIKGRKATDSEISEMSQLHRDVFSGVADACDDPRLDPCFKWCIKHPDNDFDFARSWRRGGKMRISKHEGQLRRDEWNSWVDEYISKRERGEIVEVDNNDHHRDAEEIVRLNKVSWSGGAMLRKCGNGQCSEVETRESEFRGCSACGIVMYHHKSCQKAHWKEHKLECGKSHTEYVLPSQVVMKELLSQYNLTEND
jgi:hypothetical protein